MRYMPRTSTRHRVGDAAPPGPPPITDEPGDEGPMRRELLRQIADLELQLSQSETGWTRERVTPTRGPGLLPTAALEQIRDELLTALRGPVG